MRHHLPLHRSIIFLFALFVLFPVSLHEAFAAGSYYRNQAPVISGSPVTTSTVGQSYAFRPTASDADGNRLTFSIYNKPGWASFDTSTGRLSGTPRSRHVGTYWNIVISVSDGRTSARLAPFSIKVSSATTNRTPVISGTPATAVTAGNTYSFRPTATDADGDTLVFSIANKPAWANFRTSTGRLSGTPTESNVGSYSNIIIRVSDGKVTSSLPAFGITVNAAAAATNRTPVISGTPATAVTVGNTYSFRPTATDADGDTLVFSIANKPAWVAFNTSTGRLSGTPTASNVGNYSNITISVSDGKVTRSLPAFGITVNAAAAATNRAPVISGTPATAVIAGNAYSFQPTAIDADGDTLVFSIANKPAWAAFNTSTGRLSGTPTASNVGNYSNITISVSDGKVTSSLPAFGITVNVATAATGSAALSWVAPTTRVNGSPISLSEIAGYRVYQGTSDGNLRLLQDLNDGSLTSFTATGLAAATTHYFAVTVYDYSGNESGYSAIVSKKIP